MSHAGRIVLILIAAASSVLVISWGGLRPWSSPSVGESQQLEEAIAEFEHAIELQPDNAEAWIYLGKALEWGGQPDEARDVSGRGLTLLGTESVELLIELGRLLSEQGDYQNASTVLNRAVALAPENVKTWATLGMVLSRLGRREEAISAYRQVLDLKPDHYWASHLLALLLAQQRQWVEAASLAQQAVKTAPSHEAQAKSLELLAQANVGLNDTETACKHFLDAYALLQTKDLLQDIKTMCGIVRTSLDR